MQQFTMTMNAGGQTPREPLSIYHLGQAFYLAANRCALNIEVGPNITQSLVSPAVVNYCFSIELFCKALLLLRTGAPARRIHELKDLFETLPVEDREAVRNAYEAIIPDPSLAQLLEQASNYFQEVRYQYEYNIFAYQETPLAILAKSIYTYSAGVVGATSIAETIQG